MVAVLGDGRKTSNGRWTMIVIAKTILLNRERNSNTNKLHIKNTVSYDILVFFSFRYSHRPFSGTQ